MSVEAQCVGCADSGCEARGQAGRRDDEHERGDWEQREPLPGGDDSVGRVAAGRLVEGEVEADAQWDRQQRRG
jgi:hypothetical protein